MMSDVLGGSLSTLLLISLIGGIGGVIIAHVLVFLWFLFWAPYKQRDEARRIADTLLSEHRAALKLQASQDRIGYGPLPDGEGYGPLTGEWAEWLEQVRLAKALEKSKR